MTLNNQESLNQQLAESQKSRWKKYPGLILLLLTLALVGGFSLYGAYKLGFGHSEISVSNGSIWDKFSGVFRLGQSSATPTPTPTPIPLILTNFEDYVMPKKEADRLDILVLGMRGEDDPDANETGAFLTDTIMLISVDKKTKKSSLVSIPRDLFVIIYEGKEDKINSIYEIGLLRKQGIEFTRKLFSQITGVYIDNVAVFDFSAFKQIVDTLGGIDITLEKPFSEPTQWGYSFELPAGDNHLDGEKALYFVRSRYSTDDFNRAERQQKVVTAVVEKIKALNVFSNPGTALELANTIRKNMDTDLSLWDAPSLLNLANDLNGADAKIQRTVVSTENLVYAARSPIGAYILLPNGDTFSDLKKFFAGLLE